MEKEKKPLLRPIIDFAFKKIFADGTKKGKIILVDLLNSILALSGKNKITEITYMNPFNDKEYSDDKKSILDIKVKNKENRLINIEIQLSYRDNFRKRSLYYWSKMYGETIEESECYHELKKTIVINILNFNILHESDKYHNIFVIKENKENFILVKDLEINYLELKKFDDEKDIEDMSKLELWLAFLKDAGIKKKKAIFKRIREKSEVINMASEKLEELSQEEKARQLYLQRQKWLKDEISKERYQKIRVAEAREKAKLEGKKEGKEEGRKEGKLEGKKEGKKEELRQTVLILLKQKFEWEKIPEKYASKFETASYKTLDKIRNNILNITSPGDIDNYIT